MSEPDATERARACAERAGERLAASSPTEGFALVEVWPEGDDVLVAFRWKLDPHTYVTRHPSAVLPMTGEEPDGWQAEGVEWAQEWADCLGLELMEELDTGLMARARRSQVGDRILLTRPSPAAPDGRSHRVAVSEVPQYSPRVSLPLRVRARLVGRWLRARVTGRPDPGFGWVAYAPLSMEPGDGSDDGQHLAQAGLDIALPLALREQGQLTEWVQAHRDDLEYRVLGHAAVGPVVAGHAEIVLLETVPGAPAETADELVALAVRFAADAGARTVAVPGDEGSPEREIATDLLDG